MDLFSLKGFLYIVWFNLVHSIEIEIEIEKKSVLHSYFPQSKTYVLLFWV